VLRGHLDNVTSLGYIEGWALDTYAPTTAVEVSIIWNGAEVAWGLAHRFREDLMTAAYGLGWCAFRLRLAVPISEVLSGAVVLAERATGEEIFAVPAITLIDDPETPISTIEDLARSDPTVIAGVWQLRQCNALLMQFIRQHGVETFLSVAYTYVLGRPADESGLALYTRCIRQATLTPVAVLESLEDSDEFRSGGRQLAAPNAPTFPFV